MDAASRLTLRAGFMFGFALAFLTLVPPAPPAQATHDCDFGWAWQVPLIKNNAVNRGVEAASPYGMWVPNSLVGCERVSSVFLWRNSMELVEFASFEQPGGTLLGPNQCGRNTSGPPEMLIWYRGIGLSGCLQVGHVLTSQWHTFEINNSLVDGDFDFYYDGQWQGVTPNLGWNSGYNIASAERTGTHGSRLTL